MTVANKIAREDAITEALRAADLAIGDEAPTPQALRIIAALKRLRSGKAVRVSGTHRVDYLSRVQEAARAAWLARHGSVFGPEHDAMAGVDTPIGRLRMVTWRTLWSGGARGERIAWAGEYYLDDEPITVAEIKDAGLAQRRTQRTRQRKERVE